MKVRRSVSGVVDSDSGVNNGGVVCGAPNERLDSVLTMRVNRGVCRVCYVFIYRLNVRSLCVVTVFKKY